jgi:hypothetical protein
MDAKLVGRVLPPMAIRVLETCVVTSVTEEREEPLSGVVTGAGCNDCTIVVGLRVSIPNVHVNEDIIRLSVDVDDLSNNRPCYRGVKGVNKGMPIDKDGETVVMKCGCAAIDGSASVGCLSYRRSHLSRNRNTSCCRQRPFCHKRE